MDDKTTELLAIQEQFGLYVATINGLRQQLIDAGWTAEHAEEVVLLAIKQSNSS